MNKSKYEGPFNFPDQILHQIAECSKDGSFLLIYKADDNSLVPIFNANSQVDALALTSFTSNYLTALNNIDVGSLIEMFRHSMEEQLEELDEEDEE